jgi:tetratricopeptide (TPR) repeat protein
MKRLRTRHWIGISLASVLALFLLTRVLIKQVRENYFTPEDRTTQVSLLSDEDPRYSLNPNFHRALSAYERKDYLAAIEELNVEISQYRDHARAYLLLGRVYEEATLPGGRYYSRSVQNYEEYLRLRPTGDLANVVKLKIAQYYVRVGLIQRRPDLLQRAEMLLGQLDSTQPSVRMAWGAIYLQGGDYAKAIREFEGSANLGPADLKIKYNSLGLAYLRMGRYASAQNVLQLAAKIEPTNKLAHNNLGFAYAQQGKYEEEHFQEALRIDGNYKNAEKNLRWVEKELEGMNRKRAH